nr:uncharacterized protein CI109_006288 [Kwoniella shandongensis]KAA5525389.1 hypothetical protein CI109_006288 [Kwoniella shandongensis]
MEYHTYTNASSSNAGIAVPGYTPHEQPSWAPFGADSQQSVAGSRDTYLAGYPGMAGAGVYGAGPSFVNEYPSHSNSQSVVDVRGKQPRSAIEEELDFLTSSTHYMSGSLTGSQLTNHFSTEANLAIAAKPDNDNPGGPFG